MSGRKGQQNVKSEGRSLFKILDFFTLCKFDISCLVQRSSKIRLTEKVSYYSFIFSFICEVNGIQK